jgi:lipid II:glycine glycyltransferase (peptidoglycan interpeptide bridge formation enzyme)
MMDIRTITPQEHLNFIRTQTSVSFLQTPAWGKVKSQWRSESIGWYLDGIQRGAALILYRKVPRVNSWLAYIPEGPALDWGAGLEEWLAPLIEHLRRNRTFLVRMGPPLALRSWSAETIKSALASGQTTTLRDLTPDDQFPHALEAEKELHRLGWRPPKAASGFDVGQPQYVFQLPLDGATEEEIFAGFNQQWRRNVRKAEKLGVIVRQADSQSAKADLSIFHELYSETAERDHFTPRPLEYFLQMWEAMRAEDPERISLYIAELDSEPVAATTMVKVGAHAWYSYGASSTKGRDARPSNAIQWRMITDAKAAQCRVYDMRGITPTLNPEDSHVGLIQFKVGTGGRAVEYLGEWELPLRKGLARAFSLYLRLRR